MGNKQSKKEEGFYNFLSENFEHDNNIWSYIEELWTKYNKPPTKNDKINEFLGDKGLEGYPEWDDEGTKLLKYKKWDIWAVNVIGSKQWGLFGINIKEKQIIPLNTQKSIFAIEILKEELSKLYE